MPASVSSKPCMPIFKIPIPTFVFQLSCLNLQIYGKTIFYYLENIGQLLNSLSHHLFLTCFRTQNPILLLGHPIKCQDCSIIYLTRILHKENIQLSRNPATKIALNNNQFSYSFHKISYIISCSSSIKLICSQGNQCLHP